MKLEAGQQPGEGSEHQHQQGGNKHHHGNPGLAVAQQPQDRAHIGHRTDRRSQPATPAQANRQTLPGLKAHRRQDQQRDHGTIRELPEGAIELYCTYFDHNYLRKGLALYLSLRRQSRPERAVVVVLALSERCEQILRQLALPDLIILPLAQLEQRHPQLLHAKANRNTVEYFFTLTPWVIQAALAACPDARRATYLDSDLYFFASPAPLWREINQAPVVMVEHRFAPGYEDKIAYGRFNVGWNTFDRSAAAQQALQWWADRCLEWCYDRIEGDKFADQGYLNSLYRTTPGVHVLAYPGINLAEYNLDHYALSLSRQGPAANGLPVIYWHMHCLFEQANGGFKVMLRPDLIADPVIQWAYQHYISVLQHLNARLEAMGLPIDRGNARYPHA